MPDIKISILLNGGMDTRSESELVQPVARQGSTVKLRNSINTRLSKRIGSVARSPRFVQVDNPLAPAVPGEARYGLFTAANGKATLALRAPYRLEGSPVYADAGRVSPGSALSAQAFTSQDTPQTAAATARVVDAGSVGQYAALSNIATAYSATLDQVWTAYWAASSAAYGHLLVSVRKGDGTILAGPAVIVFEQFLGVGTEVDGGIYPLWCGLTEHGANGVSIWWHQPADDTLRCQRAYVDANALIALTGSEALVVTVPAYASASTDPAYGIDVCSGGDDYAYVATTEASAATSGRVIRWNVVANSLSAGYTFAGASLGAGQSAISSEVIRGTRYVACSFGSVTNNHTTGSCFLGGGGALTPLWTAVLPEQGTQGVGFLDVGYDDGYYSGPRTVHLIGVISGSSASGLNRTYPSLAAPWLVRIIARTCDVTSGPDAFTFDSEDHCVTLPFRSLQTHVAQWSPTSTTTFPVFGASPTYGKDTDAVGQPDYVDDPSLDFYTLRGHFRACPIARIGCVRGTLQAPARIQVGKRLQSKSLVMVAQRAFAAYRQLAETSGIATVQVDLGYQGSPGRYAVLDFSPTQLTVAHDKDGSVYIASALPYQWDGRDLFELGGFLHTPHMSAAADGGGPLTGPFHGRLVHRMSDAAGSTHRSRPSHIQEITLTTEGLAMYGDPAQSMTRQTPLAYYYLSESAGKTEHLVSVASQEQPIIQTVPTTSNPMVYTTEADGSELAPQPPPPAWDIGIVGSRAWIVDAELRTRCVYSKLRVAGVGYEFAPALEVALPSGVGDAYAVREWAGFPVILAERAVLQVSGDGPSNVVGGGGSSFSPPVKISDYGCSNTASVAVFPTGIIWQFHDRFVLLSADGVQLVPDFLCTEDVSAALVLTRSSEVLFFSASSPGARVYNYEFNRWTVWDAETLPDPVTQVSLLPYDPDTALVYSQSTGILRRLESNTYSAATHMTLEADWLLLGGDFQDHVVIRELVFSAVISGPHGFELDLWMDYEATPSTHREWTAAQVTTMGGAAARYTVRVTPDQHNCRAFRVRVRDVVDPLGEDTRGMAPRSLTVGYALDGTYYEEVFNDVSDV